MTGLRVHGGFTATRRGILAVLGAGLIGLATGWLILQPTPDGPGQPASAGVPTDGGLAAPEVHAVVAVAPEVPDDPDQRVPLRLDPVVEAAETGRQIPSVDIRPTRDELIAGSLESMLAHRWFRTLYGDDLEDDAPFVASLYRTLKEVREQHKLLESQLNEQIIKQANARMDAGERPGSRPQVEGELGLIMACNLGTGWIGLPPSDHRNDAAYEKRAALRTWDVRALDRLAHLERTPENAKTERR
ncbi:MAG TPA: hypothetical protein VK348_07145 [Planctomycetota bacterium]|nr:hypothetical protein [Planctomycetota bacterium]